MYLRYLLPCALATALGPLAASLSLDDPTFQFLSTTPRSIDTANNEANTTAPSDTDPDIFFGSFLSPGLTLLTNNGSGFDSPFPLDNFEAGNNYVLVADVNGDGLGQPDPAPYLDLVQATRTELRWFRRSPASGALVFEGTITATNDTALGGPPINILAVDVADVNQDGRPDLLVMASNELSWYARQADGSYLRTIVFQGSSLSTFHVADVNRDTYPDLFTNQGGTLGLTYFDPTPGVMNFEGNRTLSNGVIISLWNALLVVGSNGWIDTADLDGDNDLELFSPLSLTWYNGTWTGSENPSSAFDLTSGTSLGPNQAKSITVVDADNDGLADVLAIDNGRLITARRTGPTTFDPAASASIAPYNSISNISNEDTRVHVVDLEGDGRSEIILPPVRLNFSLNGTLIYRQPEPTIYEVNFGRFPGSYIPTFPENFSPGEIEISLSEPAPFDIMVRLRTTDETALAGVDYIALDEVVTIPADSLLLRVPVTILDNAAYDEDRTFTLELLEVSPSDGTVVLGNVPTRTATIRNDERVTIETNDFFVTVNEDVGTANLTLQAVPSTPVFPTVNVSFETFPTGFGNLATPGADYTTTTGTLNFAPGHLTQTISVPITDDEIEEVNEFFAVLLSTTDLFADLFENELAVEITDNDTLTFAEATAADGVPPGVSDPFDDASGDGVPNIYLYALGLSILSSDPFELTRRNLRAGDPVATGLGVVEFIIPEPSRADVRYIVEESCNGGPWTIIATKEGRNFWTGNPVLFLPANPGEANVRIFGSASDPRCFLRLRLELIGP